MAEKLYYPSITSSSSRVVDFKAPDRTPFKAQERTSFTTAHSLSVSFKYAWAGVCHTFRTQRNFRIHVCIGSLALGLGFFLGLPAVQMAVITLTAASVMVLELLNTAIEAVVDLTVGCNYHRLAKTAKDCAAGTVLLAAIAALGVAGTLLLPPLATWVQFSLLEL